MASRLPLLIASLLIAGCAQPVEPPAARSPGLLIAEDRPDTSFGRVETGPAAAPDLNATTAAAPRLVPGEWWRIRFDSPFYEAAEVVRVVAAVTRGADASADASGAAVEPDGYLVGMPHEGWFKEAIAYHAPAFGDVGLDLSYETHNERFEPLRFPLVEGATWTTLFAMAEFTATVESADESTATIRFDPVPPDPQPTDPVFALLDPFGGMGGMRLVYDAREHEVVRMSSGIGTWEVVEHGYGFTGWVTVPRGLHTAIEYGQFLPVTPGEPIVTRTQQVEGGFNRLTLLHAIVPLGPGAYRIRAVSPHGTQFVTEAIPGSELTFRFYEASAPDGEWRFEDVVGGPGATYTMGMAYHQYDINLPDGARRSDHSHPVVR